MVPYVDFRRDWGARHGGIDADSSRWVDGWLRLSYACALPFVRLGISADAVTMASLLAALGAMSAAAAGWWVIAAVLVGCSGLLDGIDGAVAASHGRAGPWGAVLDSVVDRLSDAAFLGALWLAGAPPAVCLAGWVGLGLLEYSRARATTLGAYHLPLTVGERPTRLAVIAMFLLAAGVLDSTRWVTAGAVLVAVLSAVGSAQLVVATHRRLTDGRGQAGPTRSATMAADMPTRGSPPPG